MDDPIKEYINKQKSPKKEVCLYLRNLINQTLPGVKEEMKWGAIVFDNGKFYIGAVKYGVNLGFAIKGLTDKEANLFEGNGKTMRHIKIVSLDKIDKKKLVKLILLVNKKARCVSC